MNEFGSLFGPEIRELIREKRWDVLRETLIEFDPSDVAEILTQVPDEDDVAVFRVLPRDFAAKVFSYLPRDHQDGLLRSLTNEQTHAILKGMTPDDQARLLEELPAEVTRRILESLSPEELRAARDLLGYPAQSAGRYMTPQYVALLPGLTAAEALDLIRRVGRGMETLNIVYVVGEDGRLLKELRLGSLVLADPRVRVGDIEDRPLAKILATADREEAVALFRKYDRVALPVVDRDDHMLGIITADDVLDVAEREATEDIQKIGGMEALDKPYLEVSYSRMVWKRGVWLTLLFLGGMLTTTAMGHFEHMIQATLVLTLFVPQIIGSGGNSGSQAATLVIRSLALAELRLHDWWRVALRELRTGLTLGMLLGLMGFVRIWAWNSAGVYSYPQEYWRVGLTVWASLAGIVTFGSLVGSMFPFLLSRLGIDPATSSAPFVATLVDVTGLVIYFYVALVVLH